MPKSKKAKKAARKGGRKSAKRAAAARKAARTRAEKARKRSLSAKKAARTRARGGKKSSRKGSRKGARKGKRKARETAAEKPRKKPRKKAKKGGRKGRKREDSATKIAKLNLKLANLTEHYRAKRDADLAKLAKAEGSEKVRLEKRIAKLRSEHERELARLRERLRRVESTAAERRKGRKGKGRKGKRRGGKRREKNPIGSGGMHEYGAVAGGVLTAIALTIIPYRMIRSHALQTSQGGGGSGMIDQPAQGDVPNLLTGQLPLWSRLKWKGAIALGVVLVGDIAVPLFVASRIKTSDGWKTFFQLWGWTSVGLASTKLVVDVLAFATKNTSLGQRLFAPENTSRDVRAMSATTQLPAIAVAPGVGMPGLTGYGSPPDDPKRHTGAAGCGCGDCEAKRKTAADNQPGTKQPITGTTPLPPTVASTVTGLPQNSVTAPGAAGAAGAAGAPGTVTPINKFAPKNRFDSKSRFGNQ